MSTKGARSRYLVSALTPPAKVAALLTPAAVVELEQEPAPISADEDAGARPGASGQGWPPDDYRGPALWVSKEHDEPVTITGLAGRREGVRFFTTAEGAGALPESELAPAAPGAAPVSADILPNARTYFQDDAGAPPPPPNFFEDELGPASERSQTLPNAPAAKADQMVRHELDESQATKGQTKTGPESAGADLAPGEEPRRRRITGWYEAEQVRALPGELESVVSMGDGRPRPYFVTWREREPGAADEPRRE